jgi:predicted NAD/FAD-binding protein
MKPRAEDIRLDRVVAGQQRGPLRITHLPTGVVLDQKPGESRGELRRRFDAAVAAAQPEEG